MTAPPPEPGGFAWLIDNFATQTPGVRHALLLSADGLALACSQSLDRDRADRLASIATGMLSLGRGTGELFSGGSCEHVLLGLNSCRVMLMAIGELAGLAVVTNADANVGVVAHEMNQLVGSVGHALTPERRDELVRRATVGAVRT